jgi:O-antigen biosynthesis protein WbqV
MIRLAGLEPDRDVMIEFTGLRPGEKLTEILSSEDEPLQPTTVPGILMASPQVLALPVIDAFIDDLADAAKAGTGTDELTALLERARRNELTAASKPPVRKSRAG